MLCAWDGKRGSNRAAISTGTRAILFFYLERLNMANLRAVIGKLNPTTRNALEGAAGLCLSRTHYNVEIEHFLMKLLDGSGADFAFIARHFGIDKSRLASELNRSLD